MSEGEAERKGVSFGRAKSLITHGDVAVLTAARRADERRLLRDLHFLAEAEGNASELAVLAAVRRAGERRLSTVFISLPRPKAAQANFRAPNHIACESEEKGRGWRNGGRRRAGGYARALHLERSISTATILRDNISTPILIKSVATTGGVLN